MKRRILSALLLLALLICVSLSAFAAETEETEPDATPIYTAEDLMAIRENPAGSYILMADLDMTGIEWKAIDFSGSFDGNGHAILNLTLSQPGDEMPDSCDGNLKLYETTWFGLFGTMRGAEVKNLQLLNVRAVVEWDSPCFVAGIAGYAEDCTITNCTVTGSLELRAHDRIFGVGGIVGFGSGTISDCAVDMTLITVDTDDQTKDEQFLGGVYATGYIDVLNCRVAIDGYVSEHGYVHCGGIVGMYLDYPLAYGEFGRINDNYVSGKITFFEKTNSRRAYCEPFIGEPLVSYCNWDGNEHDFQKDERDTYDVELRPELCAEPVYAETVIAPGCDTYGYTEYTCQSCGYAYTDHFTPFRHTVTTWTITQEPTTDAEGKSVGYCDGCGLEFERTEPVLEIIPTTAPLETTEAATEPSTAPVEPPAEEETDSMLPILIGVAVLLAFLAVILICMIARRNRKKRK